MKRVQKHSYWYAGVTVVVALIVTISFQNCGKAGFETGDSSGGINLGSVDQTKVLAPLAFSASFDTVSYMSCFGNGTLAKPGFYSIQAGAYTTMGGMRVTPEFVTYAQNPNNIPPRYPDQYASIDLVKQFLAETPNNISSMPQMAIRRRVDLRVVQSNSKQATLGIDFINLTFDPTDDRIMDPILRASQTAPNVSYFPMAPAASRYFEGKMNYNTNEILTRDVRYDMNNYSMLTLTFAADSSTSAFRTPSPNVARAHGRGYQFSFVQPPNHYLYAPENILGSVLEINLENGAATGSNFSCPAGLRLRISRPGDRNKAVNQGGCPADPVSSLDIPEYRNRLNIIRRHLKAEHWDVSVNNLCAVPRDGDCYPTNTNPVFPVAYAQPAECFSEATSYPPGTTLPQPWCPQYVSFCTK
jgi:hypothetical protein